jgi:hypothetical protein
VDIYDLSTRSRRILHRPETGSIFDFKVAPARDLLAVLERVVEYSATQALVREGSTLVIRSATGEAVLDRIASVRSFAWSPDSRHLAYVTGTFRGQYANYSDTQAWIWDAQDRTRSRISEGGYYVSWPLFDRKVYVWQFDAKRGVPWDVIRYDPETGRRESTSHKSIYFSSTGRYYYHPGGSLREEVFSRANDAALTETSSALKSLWGWRPLAWAPDADLLLMEISRRTVEPTGEQKAVAVFDPDSDTITDVVAEGVPDAIEWGATSGELLVLTNGRVEKRSFAAAPGSKPR